MKPFCRSEAFRLWPAEVLIPSHALVACNGCLNLLRELWLMSGTEDELGCSTLTRSSAILHSLSSSPFIALYCDEKLNICSVVPSVSCTMLVMRSILLSRASLWLTYQPALH